MNAPCPFLPDPQFAALNAALNERLAKVLTLIDSKSFSPLLDSLMREVLQSAFAKAGAHEGTIWLVNQSDECLTPVYNTGPRAEEIVGKFHQPLQSGLISMVLASEQPFVENEVYKNARQSKLLDEVLKLQTQALIAVPFYLLKQCVGVISCVQLRKSGAASATVRNFSPTDLATLQTAACVLTRLIEYRLLSCTVDWNAG